MTPFRVLLLDIHEQEQLAWARDLATPLGLDLAAPLTPDADELLNLLRQPIVWWYIAAPPPPR